MIEDYSESQLIEIQKCKSDEVYTIEKYFLHDKKLNDMQTEEINNIRQNIIVENNHMARHVGKTSIGVAWALYGAVFIPNTNSVVVARKYDECLSIKNNFIKNHIEKMPWYLRPIIIFEDKLKIEFSNGSSILLMSAKDTNRLKGKTINRIYVDEYQFLKNYDGFKEECIHLLAPSGKILALSTTNEH